MPLVTFSSEELAQIGRGAIRGLVTGADTSEGSDYDVSTRMVAAVAEGTQQQAGHIARQIFPSSSDSESLIKHLVERGMARLQPAAAAGAVILTASSGTPTQPDGSLLTHVDGTEYELDGPATVSLPVWGGTKTVVAGSGRKRIIVSPNVSGMVEGHTLSIGGEVRSIEAVLSSVSSIDLAEPLSAAPSGTISPVLGVVAPVVARTTGAATNKEQGDALTLASPVSFIEASARIVSLAGGGDIESEAEMARRIGDYDAGVPSAGNTEHVRQLARAVSGFRFDDAIVFPSFRGLGTVDVFPIGVAGARQTSQAAADAVRAALEAELAYHVDVYAAPIPYSSTETDVDVQIICGVGYEPDYRGPTMTFSGTLSTTSILEVGAIPLTSTIKVGDRVLVTVKPAGRWRTYQRKVIQLDRSAQRIFIDEPLPIAPVSTDPVLRPGGPLFEPVYAAIETLFESLGPSSKLVGSTLGYERHPVPSVRWDDTLRLSSAYAAVKGNTGVHNALLIQPVADVQPNPQEVVRPGKIIVRLEEIT